MTQKGYLISISGHRLNKNEYGPICKASFEEKLEILLDAGIFSKKDEFKRISENILFGKFIKRIYYKLKINASFPRK